jgi:hypothetical protein
MLDLVFILGVIICVLFAVMFRGPRRKDKP